MKFLAYIKDMSLNCKDSDEIILTLSIGAGLANAEDIKDLILAQKLKDSTPYILELKEK